MPKARTKELWNAALTAFRTNGTQYSKVGSLVGLHRGTVRKLYWEGWPDREGCGPIKGVLEMERLIVRAGRAGADPDGQVQVAQEVLEHSLSAAKANAYDAASMLAKAAAGAQAAEQKAMATLAEAEARLKAVEELSRAKMDETQRAAEATLMGAELEAKRRLGELLQKAKVDAAETLADEANAVKFGRRAALGAAAVAALVLKDAAAIAGDLREAISGAGKLKALPPLQAIRIARELMRLTESAEKAVILALQAERLRVGDPTEVVGIMAMEQQTLEERETKARAISRALEKQRAKLHVVQGGADATGQAGGAGEGQPGATAPRLASGTTP